VAGEPVDSIAAWWVTPEGCWALGRAVQSDGPPTPSGPPGVIVGVGAGARSCGLKARPLPAGDRSGALLAPRRHQQQDPVLLPRRILRPGVGDHRAGWQTGLGAPTHGALVRDGETEGNRTARPVDDVTRRTHMPWSDRRIRSPCTDGPHLARGVPGEGEVVAQVPVNSAENRAAPIDILDFAGRQLMGRSCTPRGKARRDASRDEALDLLQYLLRVDIPDREAKGWNELAPSAFRPTSHSSPP
jgi:hypothetical protein